MCRRKQAEELEQRFNTLEAQAQFKFNIEKEAVTNDRDLKESANPKNIAFIPLDVCSIEREDLFRVVGTEDMHYFLLCWQQLYAILSRAFVSSGDML